MIIAWPLGAKFFRELVRADEQSVERARQERCSTCGARLDRADFPRKVRGIPPPWEEAFNRRFSLCCARDGCRRRRTPASVRFLGRRVYAAVVVLIATLEIWVAVPPRTRRRWTRWWQTFPETPFWRTARAMLMPPVDETRLPLALVERFARDTSDREGALLAALRWLSPLGASPSFLRDSS